MNYGRRELLLGLPFGLFLFILPFPGTVALRLLCLTAIFVIALLGWRDLQPPELPCKPMLLIWAGLALLSLTYAVDPAYSLGEIKNEIGYTMMAFVAFFAMTKDSARLNRCLAAVIAVAMLVAGWALWAGQGSGAWDDSAAHGGRGTFASLAVMAMPLVMLLWRNRSRLERTTLGTGVALILCAAVISEQRIVWAALGLQCVVVLALLAQGGSLRLKPTTFAALLVASVTIAGTALLLVHERKVDQSPVEYYDLNHDIRLQQWGRILERIQATPLTGAGFGREAMKKAYPDLVPTTPPLTLLWHPHNVFLTYGVAMGYPGIVVLALLFGSLLWRYACHLRDPAQERRLMAIAGIALIIGMVVRNLTNDLFLRDGALMFWSINGALLGLLSRGDRR